MERHKFDELAIGKSFFPVNTATNKLYIHFKDLKSVNRI